MKTVFENSMVAHVWAQQTQAHGKSNNGQMYFDGRCIYSYGSHFLAGFVVDENTVLINDDKYSITTAKHMNHIRNAVRGKYANIYYVPSLANWREAVLYNSPTRVAPYIKGHVDAAIKLFGHEAARNLINIKDRADAKTYKEQRAQFRAKTMADLKAIKTGHRGAYLFGLYIDNYPHNATEHYKKMAEANACLKATTAAQRKAVDYKYPSLAEQLKKLASKFRALSKRRKAEFDKGQKQGAIRQLFSAIRFLREDPINAPHPQTIRTQAFDLGIWNKPQFRGLQTELMNAEGVLLKRQAMARLKLWKGEMRKILAFTADPMAYMTRKPNGPIVYVPGFPSSPVRLKDIDNSPNRFAFEQGVYEAYQGAREAYEAQRVAKLKADWFAGEASLYTNLVHPRGQEFAFLRIRGDNVETSRGASVPLEHALKLYRFMKAIKQPWEGDRNAPVRVGHFTLEWIRDDVAKIGCHKLHFDDIEAAYKTYQGMVTA